MLPVATTTFLLDWLLPMSSALTFDLPASDEMVSMVSMRRKKAQGVLFQNSRIRTYLTSIFQYLDVYTLINYKERIFCSSELASVLPKINTLDRTQWKTHHEIWNFRYTLFTPKIQNLSNGAMFGPWPKGLEIPKKQMKLSSSNMFHL